MLLDAEEIRTYNLIIETDTEVSKFNDQFRASLQYNGTVFNLKVESKITKDKDVLNDYPLAKTIIEIFLDIRFRTKISDGLFGIISIKLNGYEQCVFRFSDVISVNSFTSSPSPITSPSKPTPQEILTTDNEIFEESSETHSRLEIPPSNPDPVSYISHGFNMDGITNIIVAIILCSIVGVTIISLVVLTCRRNTSEKRKHMHGKSRPGNHTTEIIHPVNLHQLRNSFIYDDM